jgi:AcrR family transcriptional regulator
LPSDRVAEIQRARMLTAAAEVVSEFGYGGMSTARVSSRAGVSRKTFYDLFIDREDCFLALFDDTVDRIVAVARPAYEGERRWREQVRAGLSSVLQFIGDEPGLGALVVVDALGAGPRDRGRLVVKPGGEPPPLTAEGVVGAVFGVLHARMLERDGRPVGELLNSLMGVIVLPYLGPAAARRELTRPLPSRRASLRPASDPLAGLDMRITYRTLRVLAAVAAQPGASNREVADHAEIADAGQVSKLLGRLGRLGLIANRRDSQARGECNVWMLTARGNRVQQGIEPRAGG